MIRGTIKIDVSGIEAVISVAKSRSITLKGARAGGRLLRVAARAAAPKRTGALRQAQGLKVAKGTKSGSTASYAVQGARRKVVKFVKVKGRKTPSRVIPAFYDHLIQLGTRPHALGKGESIGRSGGKRRKAVAVTKQSSGKHPGSKPNPYRKRAWDSVKDAAGTAAVKAMGEATQKEIARQAAKMAAKAKGGK